MNKEKSTVHVSAKNDVLHSPATSSQNFLNNSSEDITEGLLNVSLKPSVRFDINPEVICCDREENISPSTVGESHPVSRKEDNISPSTVGEPHPVSRKEDIVSPSTVGESHPAPRKEDVSPSNVGDSRHTVTTDEDKKFPSILKQCASKVGNTRVKGKRRTPRLFPTQQERRKLDLQGYTIMVSTYIQNLKVPAIFDTGASSTVISPHVLAKLHQVPEMLPYDKSYGGVCPETRLLSQGVIPLSFQLGEEVYNYRAVVADIDCPFIIGADFMVEHQASVKFKKDGGKVHMGCNNSSFPLIVVKKLLAQWVKTKITESLQPGEERVVPVRMVDYSHRDRPQQDEAGLLEPVTALRAKGVLAPYAYMTAGQNSSTTLYNSSEETIFLDAGTIIGYWTPAKILTRSSLELPEEEDCAFEKDFDPCVSKQDQGYESGCEDRPTDEYPEKNILYQLNPEPKNDEDTARNNIRRSTASCLPSHLESLIRDSDLTHAEKKKSLRALLRDYQDVMVDPDRPLGRTHMVEHRIDTGDSAPIRQAVRPPVKSLAGTSEAEVKKMLDEGLIRPSDSPWASPVVLVKKKDGSTRFCVDYRKLNEVTRKDAYPLPRIDSCFDCLGKSQWFCTLDLRSGYWQVPVAEEDIEKTAFITPQGLFEYLVMPFGLTNAPATFERLMERVLKGLQWKQCLVYIDDIIIFGSTFRETICNLKQVLQRLRQAGLTCKTKKCELFRRRVAFLGHIVSSAGLECDPEKTRMVAKWPIPKTVRDIRSFLGLAGYYRRFIPNFAEYSSPLTELTKLGVPFKWTEKQQIAFEALKKCLCNPPILSYPTDDGMYVLDTDASQYGIGAVLSQVQGPDEEEKVIAYASKTLQGAQRTYCTTKKELYAMVHFVKHFRHYLLGRRFLVRTDHASLLWLLNFKNPEGILARWLMTLSSYMPFDYIAHRPGRLHGNADAMSRIPVDESTVKRCPSTYTGCPSCYPGAITIDVDPGEKDVSLVICQAQNYIMSLRRSQSDKKNNPKKVHFPAEEDVELSSDEEDEDPSLSTPRDVQNSMQRANFKLWSLGWDSTFLRQAQSEDEDISPVLQRRISHDHPPAKDLSRRESHDTKTYWSLFDSLHIIDRLLYRKYQLPSLPDPVFQLVLPRKLRNDVLRYAHDNPLAGHRGENGTINTVRRRFYWPSYRQDVKLYVRACDRCQRSKPRDPGRAPLTQTVSAEPMECCAMDLLGPFDPPTDSGNRYILVIGDTFSKWVEAYAIPNKEANTVANRLVDFFCRFGLPQRLHSDRGLEFHNQVLDEIAKVLHIQPSFTTAYRPQSNGMIERFNRTLIKMLKTFIDDYVHPTTWDSLLPMLTGAYRATEHSSTGCTPNLLFTGREASIPLDVLAGAPPRQRTFYNAASYGQWLTKSMSTAHQYARRVLEKSATRQKRGYDNRSKKRKWSPSIGEWVYFFYPPYNRYKLGSPWTGPYVVVKKLPARTWLIQAAPDRPSRVVHEDNLKPVQGRLQNADNWIRQRLKEESTESSPEDVCQSPSETDEEDESTDPVLPRSDPEPSRRRLPPLPEPKQTDPTSVNPPSRDEEKQPSPPTRNQETGNPTPVPQPKAPDRSTEEKTTDSDSGNLSCDDHQPEKEPPGNSEKQVPIPEVETPSAPPPEQPVDAQEPVTEKSPDIPESEKTSAVPPPRQEVPPAKADPKLPEQPLRRSMRDRQPKKIFDPSPEVKPRKVKTAMPDPEEIWKTACEWFREYSDSD